MKICPTCNSSEHLKKIQYGMPSDKFNFGKYHVGGCIPSDATVHCSICGWEDDPGENMTKKALR